MTTGSPHLPDDHPAVIEMQGLVDTLRELVHHHLPGERERFETLLVDFSALWSVGDPVRRVLRWAWRLLPSAVQAPEPAFIAELAALGHCTATEARALIELDYGRPKGWRIRRALRRAAINRPEKHQFDRGENLLDRLPSTVWNERTTRARKLWNTARREAAAGRAAATALTQLVGLLQAAAPEKGWSVALVASRALLAGACTQEERHQVVNFCERWAGRRP